MPPGGMSAHVRRQNAPDATQTNASKGQQKFDDLLDKLPPRPNSAAPRQQSQSAGPRAQQQQVQKQARSAAQSRDPSRNRAAIYDTDASEADKTSAAHSERRASDRELHAALSRQQHLEAEDEYSDASEDESDEDEQLPTDPFEVNNGKKIDGRLNERQQQKMMKGFRQKHIKGDSYPSTTSGPPSHLEPSEQIRPVTNQPPAHLQVTSLPQAGGQRQKLPENASAGHGQQPTAHAHHQNHHTRQENQARAPLIVPTMQGGPVQLPAAAGLDAAGEQQFTFGKAAPRKTFPRPHKSADQQVPPTTATRPVEQSQAHAARSHPQAQPVQAQEPLDGRFGHLHKALVGQHRSESPQVPQATQHATHANRTSTPPAQHPHDEEVLHPEPGDRRNDVNGIDAERVEQDMTEDPEFDHEYDELVKMKYEDLRAEDFDVDPNAQPFRLPENMPADTLHGKLAATQRFNAGSQAALFATLPISEWEEAGDWFLERFGQVLAKYKDTRQEKRKAAKHFEDEVARRHEAVSKKRKLTEDALTDMRQSGTQVLLGTPKKGRKH